MPPELANYSLGDLNVKIFTFKNKNDTLIMHTHRHRDVHITIVAKGSVKVHGPTIGETEYKAGAVIDFEEEHPHEFIALEDNSRIVNIIKWIKDENK